LYLNKALWPTLQKNGRKKYSNWSQLEDNISSMIRFLYQTQSLTKSELENFPSGLDFSGRKTKSLKIKTGKLSKKGSP
jgi:hypothetical protein